MSDPRFQRHRHKRYAQGDKKKGVWFPSNMNTKVSEFAKLRNISESALIREAVAKYCQEQEQLQEPMAS